MKPTKPIKLILQRYMLLCCLLALLGSPLGAMGTYDAVDFYHLTNRQGLSNSQVNAILKDRQGYVWFATQSGLNRYDGFRMKTYRYDAANANSLPNNVVDEVQQAANGDLWIHTPLGYCIYKYDVEQFDRKPEAWLHSIGVEGTPQKLLVDSRKNLWVSVYGKGVYFVDTKNKTAFLFPFSRKNGAASLPDRQVVCIREQQGQAVVSFDDGHICRLDGYGQQVVWSDSYVATHHKAADHSPFVFVDHKGNYWVSTSQGCLVYCRSQRKWYDGVAAFLTAMGVKVPATIGRVLIRDLAYDGKGRIWIATDHDGLLFVDYARKFFRQFLHAPLGKSSLSDNSVQCVYVDADHAVWAGTYKNGVNYYSTSSTKFYTIPMGDICTITQGRDGRLWCGTNDRGIVAYDMATGQSARFPASVTGLGSEVVVSSVAMSDGSLYFGTYNGGMVRYAQGRWKAYRQAPGSLASNSVWTLAEAPGGKLLVGTLGGGFQLFDPATEKYSTYTTANSRLASDYISSVFMQNAHQVLIGHSQGMSVFDFRNRQMLDLSKVFGGTSVSSPSVNYAMLDSRGLLWVATPAGITMYDTHSDQVVSVNDLNGTPGAVGCAVVEDRRHTIWLVYEYAVSRVGVEKDEQGKWNLSLTNYSSQDGLQERQFNYRSACLLRNGDIAVGGQDGVNIISPRSIQNKKTHVRALFSGVVLFDHALTAGEEYEGRVVLRESLDASRRLKLTYKDNAFTIQLAASEVVVPARSRFLYRLKGASDKWLLTPVDRPEVTFANLSAGSYTLQVKVVNGDGTVNDEVSELDISVAPPFYLSFWAFMVYIVLIMGALFLYRRRLYERQRNQFERKSMEDSIQKTKELNELKLNFFTNVSHELRTPLSLIISPLESMIRNEEDPGKRRKLELIHRNATRLLNLVNQILDFRKFDQNKEKLRLANTEIVSFVHNICSSFRILANDKVNLEFQSEFPKYMMSVDADKVGKIINNLLSNAYKFTPDGGTITVSLYTKDPGEVKGGECDMVCISVADTGKGISDEEKKRVFDRFYQVDGTEMQPAGGSGIGLNLVKKFAELHGGAVSVHDNPAGGSVFVVELPAEEDGTARFSAHMAGLRSASVFTMVHKADSASGAKGTSAGEGDSDSLYGMSGAIVPHEEDTPAKPTLLLVDDSDDFREFMRDVLTDYTVIEAVDGKDAWDKIIDCRPDLILSDVMMPVMDGNELCRQLKENDETASIPFVMLTARVADEHRREGLECGADAYITKPFNIDMLNLRLRNLLRLMKHSGGTADHRAAGAQEKQFNNGNFVLSTSDQKLLDDVDIYIRDNMGDPDSSVESMSASLGISRVQLYKRLVSLRGITPSEYLRAKRIEAAERILREEPDLNVSEVAYKVGFNNPRYFSKYFQETYGVTPSQYKKQLQ